MKVPLEAIMAQTKISRRFLEAIENGEYDQLPGGVFTVNYIRQYAALVNYDPETILDDYKRVTLGEEAGAQGSKKRQGEPRWVRFFEFG